MLVYQMVFSNVVILPKFSDFSANVQKVTFDFFTVESPFPANKTIIVPSSMTIFASKIHNSPSANNHLVGGLEHDVLFVHSVGNNNPN